MRLRVSGVKGVDSEKVSAVVDVIERRQLDLKITSVLRCNERIVCDDQHAHRARAKLPHGQCGPGRRCRVSFPESSTPINFLRSQRPALRLLLACGIERASEMSKAIVCSAVVIVLPSGAFITTMPRIVAAFTSMLSTPTPARPMTRKPWPPRAAQELPWFRSALSGLHNPLVPRVNRTARAGAFLDVKSGGAQRSQTAFAYVIRDENLNGHGPVLKLTGSSFYICLLVEGRYGNSAA